MNKVIPVKKNDDIELYIDAFGSEGQGVGRYEGFIVFVAGAIDGEVVKAHIIKTTKNYAIGKLIEVVSPSEHRIAPECEYARLCGGCSLQHVDYEHQLDIKRRHVADAFERIGGFKGVEIGMTIASPDIRRYRNKASFPAAQVDGRIQLGLYAFNSHRLIPTNDCMIQHSSAIAVKNAVERWANEYGVTAFDETKKSGELRHVMVRVSTAGDVMAAIVTRGKLNRKEELIALLTENVAGIKSIIHNVNCRDTNVILGNDYETIWGSNTIPETICGKTFNVSAASFLQVNPKQTEKLYTLALEKANISDADTVADVYCGIGTISLMAADKAKRVIGIEEIERAIIDARANAFANGVENAEFICAKAEEALPKLVDGGLAPDCVILDPPRKGCDEAVLDAIVKSGVRRVCYVSCNPSTLARDCRLLCNAGFELVSVDPIDMFPWTSHVETVCLLVRRNSLHINIDVDVEEMLQEKHGQATYPQIKEYVLEHTGLKVSSLYISQIKRKCGLDVGDSYNKPKSEDAKQPQCPPEKEEAIKSALKHFGMI